MSRLLIRLLTKRVAVGRGMKPKLISIVNEEHVDGKIHM